MKKYTDKFMPIQPTKKRKNWQLYAHIFIKLDLTLYTIKKALQHLNIIGIK